MNRSDVAIVGSGPYGLSLAAHLRSLGVDFRIFGPPMKFWRDMPSSIHLKSFAHATNVDVPCPGYRFTDWCRANGLEDFEPCPMSSFANYGAWMQQRFVSNLEAVAVSRVLQREGGFELDLATGERVHARRVVFATGLTHLAHVPAELRGLPPELLSHTFDHVDHGRFRGKDVAVLGGGASAVEAAALVREAGGRAHLLTRGAGLVFHGRLRADRSLYERLRYPSSVLGPGMKSWVLEQVPFALHWVPRDSRVRFVERHLGPASPWWIQDRVEGKVSVLANTSVLASERRGDRIVLRLHEPVRGDYSMEADHVIAGTGYVADVDRLEYLDTSLRRAIRRVQRAPELTSDFQSSVRGAYFLGPVAAMSFGPLFRFVAGARYAAPTVARHLTGRRGRPGGTDHAAANGRHRPFWPARTVYGDTLCSSPDRS